MQLHAGNDDVIRSTSVKVYQKNNNKTFIMKWFVFGKVSVFGVILVRIFPHSDWIRREILRMSLYSVRMRENVDQNNSEYGHFLRSD